MGYNLHTINRQVLDNLTKFRSVLDGAILSIFQFYIANGLNLFAQPNFKLYTLISEDMRMNINYLSSLIIEYDCFDFIGIRRNLRSSIEAFYDLYNLTKDDENTYFNLLKYFHDKSQNDVRGNYGDLSKYDKYIEHTFLTIRDKAEIATKCYSFSTDFYNKYRNISIDSNSYVHYDLFVDNEQKKEYSIKNLISTDCQLLADSFSLLNEFCSRFGYISSFDPNLELNKLNQANSYFPFIVLF